MIKFEFCRESHAGLWRISHHHHTCAAQRRPGSAWQQSVRERGWLPRSRI